MRKDKMILGADVVVSTDCQETGLNNNVLICGSSGCGKTMSVIEPRLLETYIYIYNYIIVCAEVLIYQDTHTFLLFMGGITNAYRVGYRQENNHRAVELCGQAGRTERDY